MKAEAYRQYEAESGNWLKRARGRLLHTLLERSGEPGVPCRILEIGAGVGQNVPVLARFGTVDVLEIDPVGLAALRALDDVGRIYDTPVPTELNHRYDVIVALDVLEHLPDDRAAAQWVADNLAPGGRFVATVPAYQWLFSSHDVALEHYRRYTRGQLLAALPDRLRVLDSGYFVSALFPLAAGARLAGKAAARLRRRGPAEPGRKQSSSVPGPVDAAFSAVTRAEVALIARGARLPFGLSAFVLARNPGDGPAA